MEDLFKSFAEELEERKLEKSSERKAGVDKAVNSKEWSKAVSEAKKLYPNYRQEQHDDYGESASHVQITVADQHKLSDDQKADLRPHIARAFGRK